MNHPSRFNVNTYFAQQQASQSSGRFEVCYFTSENLYWQLLIRATITLLAPIQVLNQLIFISK
jgi:hypothetical protein